MKKKYFLMLLFILINIDCFSITQTKNFSYSNLIGHNLLEYDIKLFNKDEKKFDNPNFKKNKILILAVSPYNCSICNKALISFIQYYQQKHPKKVAIMFENYFLKDTIRSINKVYKNLGNKANIYLDNEGKFQKKLHHNDDLAWLIVANHGEISFIKGLSSKSSKNIDIKKLIKIIDEELE